MPLDLLFVIDSTLKAQNLENKKSECFLPFEVWSDIPLDNFLHIY